MYSEVKSLPSDSKKLPQKNIVKKHEMLKSIISSYGSAVVAFSGGVDSTFLLKVAADTLGKNALAVTLKSPSFPEREFKRAVKTAKEFTVKHVFIRTEEIENPDYIKNDNLRCYYCKKAGFFKIISFAKKNGIAQVIDGQNFDDASDYRPGSDAAIELGVKSPLREAGLTKDDIRILSKKLNIVGWDRPSFACLASRIPYGTEITEPLLKKIDNLEQFLTVMGFKQARVRHHGSIARIETAVEEFKKMLDTTAVREIVKEFKKQGYLYVTLDLEGYRTGSMNEALAKNLKKSRK